MSEYGMGNNHSPQGNVGLSSFLLGALFGAGIALLVTPRTGAEMRQQLGNTARKLRDGAGTTMHDVKDQIGHKMHDVKDQIQDRAKDVKEAISAGRDSYLRGEREPNPKV